MRKSFFTIFILILTSLFGHNQYGQSMSNKTKFHQKDFEKNKIDEETFHLWRYKYLKSSNIKDTLIPSIFVDDRNYKGLINYGVQFKSKDFKTFQFLESHRMWYLKVNFEKTVFNPKDSIIEIEGYVDGGWADSVSEKLKQKNIENGFDIFLGEKKDTIVQCYLGKVVNEELIEVKLNGRNVNESTILDTFPAFYFKNYSHYKTMSNGKRYFKIKGKVTSKTILAFGDTGCYSEVFDLSTMVYFPKKNKQKKITRSKNISHITLIHENQLLSKNGIVKTEQINYYTYTEAAENYILKRQFVKAKEQYNLLIKNYNTVFAKDIHNAIRCAVFSRDYENAYYWAEKLAKKGVPFVYFNSNIFKLLKKHKQWDSFSKKYDSIYNEFRSKRDVEFKEEIERLLQEDQADYGLANRKEPKVLFETTERVTNKLIDLLNEKGYPSEEKIGVYLINDTILDSSPAYNVIIRHAFQQNSRNQDELMNLLDIANTKLEYDKKRSPNHKGFLNSCFHIYRGNLYSHKSCGRNELMIKKMKYMFNNPHNFILDFGDFIVNEFDKENEEKNEKFYKEQFDFIIKLTDNWEFYEN